MEEQAKIKGGKCAHEIEFARDKKMYDEQGLVA